MKHIIILLLALGFYTPGFATIVSDTTDVIIINQQEPLPEGARHIGKVKITDGGFKVNCGYEHTIEQAKAKAVKAGGNLIKITELKSPDGFSTCYRLFGEIYYLENTADLHLSQNKSADSTLKSLLPDTASYALVYFYRPRGMGSLVSYDVKMNDSTVCRLKNNSRSIVKIYQTGSTTFSAKTESKSEVTIDIQPGKAYFVRGSIAMGAFVGRPKLNVVDALTGLKEYNAVQSNKDQDKLEREKDPTY
ncbi:DUF2846 domain-containing protein [Chitinophaga solisilvae]|uniref:DUF2846 domain-containing protein n=1 Tax=Chitinophaga solisilvae TaxID=1233460 RepID=UPI00136D6786|nr:DUF2846 domain-containing protein [Chitinophaga solisilvae]